MKDVKILFFTDSQQKTPPEYIKKSFLTTRYTFMK